MKKETIMTFALASMVLGLGSCSDKQSKDCLLYTSSDRRCATAYWLALCFLPFYHLPLFGPNNAYLWR